MEIDMQWWLVTLIVMFILFFGFFGVIENLDKVDSIQIQFNETKMVDAMFGNMENRGMNLSKLNRSGYP